MQPLSRQVKKARSPSPWDLTNRILYDLCREHPHHRSRDAVLAKILLIGRSYAAAIERRKEKEGTSDDFYLSRVAPMLLDSDIDSWLAKARAVAPRKADAFGIMVDVHGRTTELFRTISRMEKRSLASKYLHFHVPRLFFIYDTRAVRAIRELGNISGRASRSDGIGDNEYRKFAEKCIRLQRFCEEQFRARLSPRQIDNLLLAIDHDSGRDRT